MPSSLYETEEIWRAKAGQRPRSSGLIAWVLSACLGFAVLATGIVVLVSSGGLLTDLASRKLTEAQDPRVGVASDADAGPAVDNELIIRRSGRHFRVTAAVNGVDNLFLIDTGASDVVLSLEDARRIGVNLRTLKYTKRYQTANGTIEAAPIILRDLRIGQLRLYNVEASISKAPMGTALLGMSFLNRLSGFEFRKDKLILRW